jgi:hypothetical protein
VSSIAPPTLSKNVDARREQRLQARAKVLAAVVDGAVEAKLAGDEGALGRAAGDADDARALDLRDLRGNRAGGAGRARDQHVVAGPDRADLEHAVVRGEPGQAEHTHAQRDRHAGRQLRDLHEAGAVADGVVLPAEHAEDDVALAERRVARGDHLPGRAGAHGFADGDLRHVRVARQPAALRRIARQVQVPHQELAVGEFRQRLLAQREIRALRHALRAALENPLAIDHFGIAAMGRS